MLNESIIKIRNELQKSKIKKTGKNEFAGFDYFELSDFLPKLNELMLAEKVNDVFTIENEEATLKLVKGDETQTYKMPFVIFETPLNWKKNKVTGEIEQVKSMQDIQYLGALNTYYKRYLYLNAFGITDGEIIDKMDNTNISVKKTTKAVKEDKTSEATATPKQLEMLENTYKGDDLKKLLEVNGINELKELPITKASELIGKIIEMQKKEGK